MSGPFSLDGRNVLITGGTRGIGRAISLQFARAGARVIAVFVREVETADSLAAEAAAEGLSIRTCRADVTSDKCVGELLDAVLAFDGPLSAFVHCAATGIHRPFGELTLRHFDWTFNVNVRAFFNLARQLLPQFGPSGSILALSSIGAVRAVPQYTLVGSTKGALEAMARHMAVELAPRGIRVNVLSPGTVLTDAWKVLPDAERRLAAATARSPQRRFATLEEVASAAQFLCSDAATGIVGQTLVVDAGFSVAE